MEKMVEKGLVPDHLLEEVRLSHPDVRVMDAAELLHSIICMEQHGMEPADCKYHNESMYPDPAENPYHRRWVAYAEKLIDEYKLDTGDLKGLVREIVELNTIVVRVGDCYVGEATKFILDVMSNRLPPMPPVQAAL